MNIRSGGAVAALIAVAIVLAVLTPRQMEAARQTAR